MYYWQVVFITDHFHGSVDAFRYKRHQTNVLLVKVPVVIEDNVDRRGREHYAKRYHW
jgi:hypothetical protein